MREWTPSINRLLLENHFAFLSPGMLAVQRPVLYASFSRRAKGKQSL